MTKEVEFLHSGGWILFNIPKQYGSRLQNSVIEGSIKEIRKLK